MQLNNWLRNWISLTKLIQTESVGKTKRHEYRKIHASNYTFQDIAIQFVHPHSVIHAQIPCKCCIIRSIPAYEIMYAQNQHRQRAASAILHTPDRRANRSDGTHLQYIYIMIHKHSNRGDREGDATYTHTDTEIYAAQYYDCLLARRDVLGADADSDFGPTRTLLTADYEVYM